VWKTPFIRKEWNSNDKTVQFQERTVQLPQKSGQLLQRTIQFIQKTIQLLQRTIQFLQETVQLLQKRQTQNIIFQINGYVGGALSYSKTFYWNLEEKKGNL
jgi:hypothetical protein